VGRGDRSVAWAALNWLTAALYPALVVWLVPTVVIMIRRAR
jgi:hypothetical protein